MDGDGVTFTVPVRQGGPCSLLLYRKNTKTVAHELPFTKEMIWGHVASMTVGGFSPASYDYAYQMGDCVTADPYSRYIKGHGRWGTVPEEPITSGILAEEFDWKDDRHPDIPFHETIMYRLHVRGFTKDKTSKVKHKGTFAGLMEKADYLQELGITMIELMPAYEFLEVMVPDAGHPYSYQHDYGENQDNYPLNYWGYTKGFYFSPKASYGSNRNNVSGEFKEMIRLFHQKGMEVSMEFSFDYNTNPLFILDCLRYWVLEYHVDGVHLFARDMVMQLIMADPVLSRTKIFSWSLENVVDHHEDGRHMASFNDGFLMTARKFLKGDEGQTGEMQRLLRYNPKHIATVNYVANHSTFTLLDTVSYDRKHNEKNGEGNNDGPEYNYSWNCGEEGPSKKRKILELRKRQIKNALAFVMTAAGVPMLYAGDEYGNSQQGNNNPYCQDNEIGWVNWKNNVMDKEILEFTRELIAFRKSHAILHMEEELKIMDYLSLGLPDISYHGNSPWYSDYDHVNRHFAIMLCGQYASNMAGSNEDLYIAYNMNWEEETFGLPTPRSGYRWECAISTAGKLEKIQDINEDAENKKLMVPPRSTVILTGRKI